MIYLKNISGQIYQLHIHEFQIDEKIEVDHSWYVDAVIEAVSSNDFEVHNNDGLIVGLTKQLDYLKGSLVDVSIKKIPPFSSATHHFKGIGKIYTINALSTGDLIATIPDGVFDMDGLQVMVNGDYGDIATLQMLDSVDGDYTGTPNELLSEFAKDWNIKPFECSKVFPYAARVYSGMQIVIKYTNNQDKQHTIYVNYNLHEVI